MNALALLNNFEREFARPFFAAPARTAWMTDLSHATRNTFSSELAYDEKTSKWLLTVELPGVTKENVKVDTNEGILEVSGEKTKGLNLGKFEGQFSLPEGVDAEKIEAMFEDGILTVHMPKSEKKTAKTILIK